MDRKNTIPNNRKSRRAKNVSKNAALRESSRKNNSLSFLQSGGHKAKQKNFHQKNPGKRSRKQKGKNSTPIYDMFGSRVHKPYEQQRSYRPEYSRIALPQQPDNLVCGICDKAIAGATEMLEALEIQPGEFSSGESTAAHFQCVLQALSQRVQLEKGESLAYLGAGKFAVIQGSRRTVKRAIERSEWSPQNSSLSPNNWAGWRQSMVSHNLIAALSIETDV